MGGNSGKGLAIIGLIIGFCGASLGAYSVFIMPSLPNTSDNDNSNGNDNSSGIIHSWFTSDSGVKTVQSTSFELMEDMNMTVQVNAGESLYGDFRGNVVIDIATTISASIKFSIDGSLKDPHVYCFSDTYVSTSLQILVGGLTPGVHTIGVYWRIYSTGGVPEAFCHKPTLLVQTLIE